MTKDEAMKKIGEGEGDFHVFTEDEHKQFLDNLKETDIFKQQIDGRVSEIYKQIDADVSSITGTPKGSDEKTYEYVKKQLAGLKTSAESMKAKNEELQKAIDSKSPDETVALLKKELEQITKKHQEKMEEWKGKYEGLEANTARMRVSNELSLALMGVKFRAEIPEEPRNAMITIAKDDIMKNARYMNEKLVFVDDKGDVMLDDMMRPVTAKAMLEAKLKSIIDTGVQKPGIDIKDPVEKDNDGKVIVNLSLPDSVKTNADLTEFLLKSGLRRGTDEYMAAYEKFREKVKIVT